LLEKKIKLSGKNSVFSLNNEVINLAGVLVVKAHHAQKNKTVIVECASFNQKQL